jgi:NAD(P)-dependent dehydrogenase (short-subunit alcohol dehydrogenase family)
MNSLDLTGQTAVVTGASGGIGRTIALSLATAGANVVVHGCSNRESLQSLAQQIEQLGRKVLILQADLTDAAAIEKLAADAWQWQGQLDLLVNNAGADVLTGEAAKWPFEKKLARLWQVDVLGCVTLSRHPRPTHARARQRQHHQHRLGPGGPRHGRRRGRNVRHDQRRRDGLHPQPGAIASAAGPSELPRPRLDPHRLGRTNRATIGSSGPHKNPSANAGARQKMSPPRFAFSPPLRRISSRGR